MSYLNISKKEPLTKYHKDFVKEYQLGPDKLPEGSYFVSEIPYYLNKDLRLIKFPATQVDIQFLAIDDHIHQEHILKGFLVDAAQLTDLPKYEVINKEIELEDISLESDDMERE